ncbi:MAG TPA: methyltransferase domain-containing protein [Mycobacteriales bacterium]|nr:methyltransferase domain-containing protein [Mycobacteriales bacterium]
MARYDQIADWYETEFLPGLRDDPLEYERLVTELLGPGEGPLLEVGCGTGAHSDRFRRLGWTPVGVDLSARMLAYGKSRLPAARGDAERMPIPLPAAAAAGHGAGRRPDAGGVRRGREADPDGARLQGAQVTVTARPGRTG